MPRDGYVFDRDADSPLEVDSATSPCRLVEIGSDLRSSIPYGTVASETEVLRGSISSSLNSASSNRVLRLSLYLKASKMLRLVDAVKVLELLSLRLSFSDEK